MATSVDAELRRELEGFIFDYYMEKLTEKLSKLGLEPGFDIEKVSFFEFSLKNTSFLVQNGI